MSRVKRGTQARKRHNNLLRRTKGYLHGRKNLIKLAHQAVVRAMHNAFRDRRAKKRNFRSLWIVRLNAALRTHNLTYSTFIPKLRAANIELNRKVLAELAAEYPEQFSALVGRVKKD